MMSELELMGLNPEEIKDIQELSAQIGASEMTIAEFVISEKHLMLPEEFIILINKKPPK